MSGAFSNPRLKRGSFLAFAALLATAAGAAAPYRPADDSVVLERLPGLARPGLDAGDDRELALSLARLYIERARHEADPRYLGYAEATLASPLAEPLPPPAFLLLRATIRQARHDFTGALADLDAVIAQSPDDAQAWLTRATILRVTGRYDQAADACNRAAPGTPFGAKVCAAAIAGLSGQLRAAYGQLQSLRASATSRPAAERAWLAAELAEAAERLGDPGEAAATYRAALAAFPADWPTRAAYGDLLLATGRAAEAAELTADFDHIDALALRRAIALRRLGRDNAQLRTRLADAFAAAHRRGEDVHLREEARYVLDLGDDPAGALELALRNWATQREPQDLLLLVRAGRAAGADEAAAVARDWMRVTRYEDFRLGERP